MALDTAAHREMTDEQQAIVESDAPPLLVGEGT